MDSSRGPILFFGGGGVGGGEEWGREGNSNN